MNSGISIQVDDKSLRKLLKNFDRYPKNVQQGMTREIYRSAIRIESKTKIHTPIRTGRLRSSFLFAPISKKSAKVASQVEYAPDVERGHQSRVVKVPSHTRVTKGGKVVKVKEYMMHQSKRLGVHMLRNAARSEFPKLVNRIRKLLTK